MPWVFPIKVTWRGISVRCSASHPDDFGGRGGNRPDLASRTRAGIWLAPEYLLNTFAALPPDGAKPGPRANRDQLGRSGDPANGWR